MATLPKPVLIRPKPPARLSPLTPELKDFIDRAIVPALVKRYLAEENPQPKNRKLASHRGRMASSDSSTAATLRVRP